MTEAGDNLIERLLEASAGARKKRCFGVYIPISDAITELKRMRALLIDRGINPDEDTTP